MISHLASNATFSTAINQANNRNATQHTKNEPKNSGIDSKNTNQEVSQTSASKLDSIKEAIKNGTYQLNLKGSAEKLAQELLN